jgi:quercetin dioxygenase-like cupin family protein
MILARTPPSDGAGSVDLELHSADRIVSGAPMDSTNEPRPQNTAASGNDVSAFRSLADIAPLPIWTGILARRVEGRHITFAVVELEPGARATRHQHPQEQLGLVLKGTIRFLIGIETRDLTVGDTYEIPSNVLHEATAGSGGAVVIDVFSPIRSDWHALSAQPARTPRWP